MLFVDLENTLIESWDIPCVCKLQVMGNLFEKFGRKCDIFSFAIWNDKDRDTFEKRMKFSVTNFHDIEIGKVWTKEEIRDICVQRRKAVKDMMDFTEFHDKESAFIDFIRVQFTEGEFILIDDMVEDSVFTIGKLVIRFIKV